MLSFTGSTLLSECNENPLAGALNFLGWPLLTSLASCPAPAPCACLALSHAEFAKLQGFCLQRRQWHPAPVLLPGESHGWRSLVGCSPWGRWESGHDWANSLSLFTFRALEKEIATHSSVLAWRIPGTGEPDGLSSMGSHRVGHDWSDLAAAAAARILSSPFLPCSLLFPLQLSFSPKSLPLNTSTETGPSSVPLRVYPHRREGLREAGKVVESLL